MIRKLPIAGAFFLVLVMAVQCFVSYRWEKNRMQEHIDYEMRLAQKDFIFKIYDVQDAGKEMHDYVERHFDQPDRILHETFVTLKRNPDILSCYVSFRPGFYHPEDYWYCPCAWRNGDSIITMLYGDDEHDYFQTRWYHGAQMSDWSGYWSPSYRDEDFAEPICTHSVRVDYNDSLACVIGLDFSMQWMEDMLEEIKPFDDAYCLLYSTDGTLLLTSDNMGDKTTLDEDMIVRSSMLSPVGMRLEIGVPQSRVWRSVRDTSLITLFLLLFGLGIATFLILRINADQLRIVRVETANKLMEHELHIASAIQRGILKSKEACQKVNADGGIEVQAALEPMREVGGDLYDFYRNGDELYFIIGDVSGKSVPAAMFMSATVNLFRSTVRRLHSPKAIMEEMNSVLSENNPSLMFVTAFIGRLQISTGQLLYCNAGHCAPLHVPFGHLPCTILDCLPNIPMGYDGGFAFEEQGTMLGEGESVILYTDGITEARNDKREMLGLSRWREIIAHQPNEIHCAELQEEIKSFMVNTVPTDDITLMVIRLKSTNKPVSLNVENDISQWRTLRTALHEYGLCAGLEKRVLKKLELALEEAVVNIVNYSQATSIGLEMHYVPSQMTIVLTDDGVPFDPTSQALVDTEKVVKSRQIGGLGITLLKQIADDLQYRRTEDGRNELTIIKNS